MQTIELKISPKGEVQIHVQGVQGEGCLELTKPLEDALGGQPVDRQFTEEYAEQAIEQINQQQVTA